MKIHTTNYENMFIEVAGDCPAAIGEAPPLKVDRKSVANLQFEMIRNHPYQYTSDDVLFMVHADRAGLVESELGEARAAFFSKGQACLRASPLTKRYGWGVHSDEQGRVAIYGRETVEYERLTHDERLKVVKAMKSSR